MSSMNQSYNSIIPPWSKQILHSKILVNFCLKASNGVAAPNIIRNIKEEVNTEAADVVSKYNCEICKKHFNAAGPLAFHYCKHFYKELQSLQFPDYMEDTKCNKCEKMLPDKKAMLCHLGVKHKFINQVLSLQGLQKIPLGIIVSNTIYLNPSLYPIHLDILRISAKTVPSN